MHMGGVTAPSGTLGIRVLRQGVPWPTEGAMSVSEIREHGLPHRGQPDEVAQWRTRNVPNLWRGVRRVLTARALKLPTMYGSLFIQVKRRDVGLWVPYGLASMRVVTTAGVRFICDDLNNSTTDATTLKFHGMGTGGTAEAVGDTALVTESTTALNPDSTRATGSQASATVSTNATYTTVGTLTVDASVANTEHGIFSQAATGGGTLLDRSLYSVINLANGDSIQFTYVLTLNSGG